MARVAKLKVYCTPIGFHDAYVAAPSQKAALKAWGSEHDLFARGIAEQVTDPALMAEPLAHPGQVIKTLRGTAAEQIAALPPDRPKPKTRKAEKAKAPPARPKRIEPPPSREPLDRAGQAIAEAEDRYRDKRAEIDRQEDALARRRKELEHDRAEALDRLERARDAAQQHYDSALRDWRERTG